MTIENTDQCWERRGPAIYGEDGGPGTAPLVAHLYGADLAAGIDFVVSAHNAMLETKESLVGALQYLLDDLYDADETHAANNGIYKSVEYAAAHLVAAGGSVSRYSPQQAQDFLKKLAAENAAAGKVRS